MSYRCFISTWNKIIQFYNGICSIQTPLADISESVSKTTTVKNKTTRISQMQIVEVSIELNG